MASVTSGGSPFTAPSKMLRKCGDCWRLSGIDQGVIVHPAIAYLRQDAERSLAFRNFEAGTCRGHHVVGQRWEAFSR
jgi:hypothetical protein